MAESGALQQLYLQDPLDPLPIETISPNAGSISSNTEVTLTGNHFVPGTELTILVGGLIPSGSLATSETSIAFTMPQAQQPGAVTIRVINPDGQSDTVTYTYQTDAIPAPALANINQTGLYLTQDNTTDALVLDYERYNPMPYLLFDLTSSSYRISYPTQTGLFHKQLRTLPPTRPLRGRTDQS